MKLIGSDTGEPEDDGSPTSDVSIRISVPEEYLGTVIGGVNAQQGVITGIEKEGEFQVILATIPASLFNSLAERLREGIGGKAILRLQES